MGGHLAAVITTLLDASWNPHSATAWEDPDGNEWNMIEDGNDVDLSPILSAVAASLSCSIWNGAAQHWNGKGRNTALTSDPCVFTSNRFGKGENTNGLA